MSFECDICNVKYKTRSGLWKHTSAHHSSDNKEAHVKNFFCSKCNKGFKHYQSRWKHEKSCETQEMIVLKEEFKQLKEEVKELKNKPSVINNYTTNNTLNDKKIIINNSPGTESIAHLSVEQQRGIMNKGLSSLMYLIQTTNFNADTPEYHSYCVTALNDKHASMIDVKTNSIIKTEKNELFDKILIGNIKKLEAMCSNKEFGHNEREVYRLKLESLKDLLFKNKRGLKKYYNELNLLSYNNKDLIIETWASLRTLDDIINSEASNKITYNPQPPSQYKIIDFSDDSDSELSESDTESSDTEDDEDEQVEIKIRGKKYILEDNKLFKITNGKKGELYGKYVNGKVVKDKEIEL
jgi:hypothetical protein